MFVPLSGRMHLNCISPIPKCINISKKAEEMEKYYLNISQIEREIVKSTLYNAPFLLITKQLLIIYGTLQLHPPRTSPLAAPVEETKFRTFSFTHTSIK